MKRSTDRILTTHVGSLPRPNDLTDLLTLRDKGQLSGSQAAGFPDRVREAVAATVHQQADAGVDVLNDGEMSKIGYSTYVKERMTGFGGEGQLPAPADLAEYPEYAMRVLGDIDFATPACTGPVTYHGADALSDDLENLRQATNGVAHEDAFMSAASPGVISLFLVNQHYSSHEEYLFALADAMKNEYDAIHQAGVILQLDCPDLAMGRHIQFPDASIEEFRKTVELHVNALNHATRDIPSDRIRIHLCWGNYDGPHHHDVALGDIVDVAFKANADAFLIEAANPRHAHEWKLFEDVSLPEGKVLIPGVIDTTNNYIEHEELIADRIVSFANQVGRENVIAGTDCGFATFAGLKTVDPNIAWAKLRALAMGSELASERLWGRN